MRRQSTPMAKRETRVQRIARLRAELDEAERLVSAGKPVKYKSEFAIRATDLCMLGLTNAELGDRFGVAEKTIEDWLRNVPEFAGAVYAGREGADAQVARAMFKAATGYEHPEDDIRTVSLGANSGSEIVITPTTKRYPPNYNAAALIFANRQRQRWPRAPVRESGGAEAEGGKTPSELAAAARAAIAAALEETPPAADPQPASQEQTS